jgi:hypothetical protein
MHAPRPCRMPAPHPLPLSPSHLGQQLLRRFQAAVPLGEIGLHPALGLDGGQEELREEEGEGVGGGGARGQMGGVSRRRTMQRPEPSA